MSLLIALIRNHPLANIAFAVVLAMGLLAYRAMPRAQDPEINFNWVAIVTPLPGASAEDVARRVTQPLEEAIHNNVQEIRFISSNSREGSSSILVRFREIPPALFDKRMNDLRREVRNAAERELPEEAEEPLVTEITSSNGFPTAMVLLTARAADERLRLAGRQVKQELEALAGVDRLYAFGLQDPELRVEFEPQRLAARGLTAADLAESVARWFRDTAAGTVPVGPEEWLVRLVGQENDPDTLAAVPVTAVADPARQVPLEAVARVFRARQKPADLAASGGAPGVLLSVTKSAGTNTIELVERLQGYIAAKGPLLAAAGVSITLLDDQTVTTREALAVMEGNAALGLALVVAVSWIFLGSRIALLVGLGIPFALAATFWLLHAGGSTLNVSVLLGTVIVLGMLVDDAVVIVEAVYFRLARGEESFTAVIESIREVGLPVLAAVLTTMAAFLPLMLLPGIVGDFMFVIPMVVTVALGASLVEAFWMLPSHVAALNLRFDRPSRLHPLRTRFTHRLRVRYARLLLAVMRRPRLGVTALAGVMAFAVALVAAGWVRVEFFAFDPLRIFYVNLDLPAGTAVETTLAAMGRAEAAVRAELRPDEARGVASFAGVKFTDTEPLYGPGYGQVLVSLNPRGAGRRDARELSEALRPRLERLGLGRVSFTLLSGGPPVTKAIRIRVRGDDPAELRAAADRLKELIAAVPGSHDIGDDEVAGRGELVLRLDPTALRAAGLDPGTVTRLIRLHVDGEIVAELRDQGDKVEVRVRGARPAAGDPAALLDDPVALPGGGTTTLRALVSNDTRRGPGAIRHYNLRRAITVEAELDKTRTDTLTANRSLREAWQREQARFPGSELDFSGEMDDIQESLDAMGPLFLLGVGLIYLILAAQFRSYFQPLMILLTVPMAFTGVVFGLWLSGNPLSLFTLYGVIALTGIAVNSAIVLIDAANARRAAGMSVLHAAVYAARRRVVPIIITSVTTIAGLFSLAAGIGGRSLLWGPVATAIVWGILVSTVLTLFFVPLVYRLAMGRRGRGREA